MTGTYQPNGRAMIKVKHERTADVVVAGYRLPQDSTDEKPLLGSLLLGLYDDDGKLQHVGVSAAFPAARRAELIEELEPAAGRARRTTRGASGHRRSTEGRMPGAQSRWNAKKDLSWVPLDPVLVAEVGYDHMEGTRFRHTTQFKRWRPDRTPESCTYEQLEEPLELRPRRRFSGSECAERSECSSERSMMETGARRRSAMYHVIVLAEQVMSPGDAAEVVSLHDGIEETAALPRADPLRERPGSGRGRPGSLAASETLAAPAIVSREVDTEETQRHIDAEAQNAVTVSVAAIKALGFETSGEFSSDDPIDRLDRVAAEQDAERGHRDDPSARHPGVPAHRLGIQGAPQARRPGAAPGRARAARRRGRQRPRHHRDVTGRARPHEHNVCGAAPSGAAIIAWGGEMAQTGARKLGISALAAVTLVLTLPNKPGGADQRSYRWEGSPRPGHGCDATSVGTRSADRLIGTPGRDVVVADATRT